MINKRISKITMLTCLMLAGVANAQEFYTCVPKKSWWGDIIKEGVEKGVTEGKKEIEENKWETIITLTINSNASELKQTLLPGKYRVTAAAAGVGMGGEKKVRIFELAEAKEYKACVGASGGNGGDGMKLKNLGYRGGGGGGGGGGATYKDDIKYFVNMKGKNANKTDVVSGGDGGGAYHGYGYNYIYRDAKNGRCITSIDNCYSSGGGGGVGGNSYTISEYYFKEGGKGAGHGEGFAGYQTNYSDYLTEPVPPFTSFGGRGGSGCYGGAGGNGGGLHGYKDKEGNLAYNVFGGGGGGGGGSYFEIGEIKFILKGADGEYNNKEKGGRGASPDGYIKIEKWK